MGIPRGSEVRLWVKCAAGLGAVALLVGCGETKQKPAADERPEAGVANETTDRSTSSSQSPNDTAEYPSSLEDGGRACGTNTTPTAVAAETKMAHAADESSHSGNTTHNPDASEPLDGSTGETASNGATSDVSGGDRYCPFLPSHGRDVTATLVSSTSSFVRPPQITTRTVLDGRFAYEGEITTQDELALLSYDDEGQCGVHDAIEHFVQVHAITLQGAGPHQVVFEVLDLDDEGLSLSTPHVYQALEGGEQAMDLEQPCLHWVAAADELTSNFGNRLVVAGLREGTVLLQVGMYDSNSRAKYQLEVSSNTSCSGEAQHITPGPDAASTPFIDPNPKLCQDTGKQNCDPPTTPPSVEWASCCLTDFAQNPEGKCGVSGNGLCLERQQPGNADDACPSGDYLISFPPNMFRDEGMGCCNWRTGRCGLMSTSGDVLDLGCVPVDRSGKPSEQPCTPDYEAGVIF